jgi:hypothetical protein
MKFNYLFIFVLFLGVIFSGDTVSELIFSVLEFVNLYFYGWIWLISLVSGFLGLLLFLDQLRVFNIKNIFLGLKVIVILFTYIAYNFLTKSIILYFISDYLLRYISSSYEFEGATNIFLFIILLAWGSVYNQRKLIKILLRHKQIKDEMNLNKS